MRMQLDLQLVEQAGQRLAGVIRKTPLLSSPTLERLCGRPVYLKAENLQITGSFKIRTAYPQIAALLDADRARGVIASSSGNFGHGVAYAARQSGCNATIVMMKQASPYKVEAVRSHGAEIVFSENTFESRTETVNRLAAERGLTQVHPFNSTWGMAGNGTAALEIVADLEQVDAVLVPASGGGLLAGIGVALKLLRPDIAVFGVQSRGSNAFYQSFHARTAVKIDRARTIADGLIVTAPSDPNLTLVQRTAAGFFQVEEDTIVRAMRILADGAKLVVEPSGAVSLAAILEGHLPREYRRPVCLVTGGNIDPVEFAKYLNAGVRG